MTPQTNERLGSYTLGPRIGRGAMGIVHSATSALHPEPVAVKVLREDLSDDDETVARFLREKRIFSTVDHPNVTKIHDFVAEGDRLGIVMELVNGGDLRALISSGNLRLTETVDLVRQIAAGLAHIHNAGVLHCDLKPANVLVSNAGSRRTIKISDFGVSKLTEDAATRTSTTIGTPLYMAPEATDSRGVMAASDIYALGVILFEMLVGAPPFHGGGTIAVIMAHSQHPAPELSGLPSELCDLVSDMLSKAPADRPKAAQVVARLKALAPLVDDEMVPSAASPIKTNVSPLEYRLAPGDVSAGIQPDRTIAVPSAASLATLSMPLRDRVADVAVRHRELTVIAALALVTMAGLAVAAVRGPTNSISAEAASAISTSAPVSIAPSGPSTTVALSSAAMPSAETQSKATPQTERFNPTTSLRSATSTAPATSTTPKASTTGLTSTQLTVPTTVTPTTTVPTTSTFPTTAAPTTPTTVLPTTAAPTTAAPTTAAPTTAAPTTAVPTTALPITLPASTTTTESPVGEQVAIVVPPKLVSVGPTSAIFNYTTNNVCGSGSFVYRNQSTGAVVGQWIGEDGCFGPTHHGTTAWPGIVLEPNTTYSVSISVKGKPSDGVLPAGFGKTTSSIVITTTG